MTCKFRAVRAYVERIVVWKMDFRFKFNGFWVIRKEALVVRRLKGYDGWVFLEGFDAEF